MRKSIPQALILVALGLLVGLQFSFFAASLSAQDEGCNYDRTNPSLDNARLNFKSLNYRCAELELLDRLRNSDITLQEKADTYVLLAAVYYAMLGDNDSERREKVVEQFTAAFKQYRDWRGTLEINSSEFAGLMEEAKRRVDQGDTSGTPATTEVILEPVKMSACPSSTPALIGTGVFVAAAGFFMISSSSVNSKWDDYEKDPAHPTDLYDDYKSANSTRNVVGYVTAGAAVVTTYLWIKYMSGKKNCTGSSGAGLDVEPNARGLQLTYRF